LDSLSDQIQDTRAQFDRLYQDLDQSVKDLRRTAQQMIQQESGHYHKRCWDQWIESGREFERTSLAIDRSPDISQRQRDQIRSRILQRQDWHWPGAIIRPGRESFITDMVSFDPLYLIDVNRDLLQPALDRFNPIYQSRLCCYEVQEAVDTTFLEKLPQDQFGFVFAFHFFEFRPQQLVENWLGEVWKMLRPGGRFLFTYNDCSRPQGITVCERGLMSYTPGAEVMLAAQRLGFEILDQSRDQEISWMQLAKPGDRISLRGSQTLAKIVAESK
jgi:SAM-dependent methyltransferase